MFNQRVYFIIILLLGIISVSNAVTNITDCQNITVSGEYNLINDINNNVEVTCFEILASDVLFDCLGNTIDGSYFDDNSQSELTFLINATNVSVKNCVITDYKSGFFLYTQSSYSVLSNISLESDGSYAISITSNYNNITGITLTGGDYQGITLTNANNNLIYNVSMTINEESSSGDNWGNNQGIYLYDANNNTIFDVSMIGVDYEGVYTLGSDYNKIYDIVINDADVGINYDNGWYNQIYNIDLNNIEREEFNFEVWDLNQCNNEIYNITGVLNKPILYYNETVDINSWDNNFSQIILCGADNSTIVNVVQDFKTNDVGSAITIYESSGIYLDNINISNNYYGIKAENIEFTNFNNINVSNNRYGIRIESSVNIFFNNLVADNNSYMGLEIYSSSNIFLEDIYASNNQYGIAIRSSSAIDSTNLFLNDNNYGIEIEDSEDVIIVDSQIKENRYMNIYYGTEDICNMNLANVTGDNDLPILFYNQTMNIDSWSNFSQLILCDADNSVIENLELESVNKTGNTLQLINSNNLLLNNLTFNEFFIPIYAIFMNYSNLTNLNLDNNENGFWFGMNFNNTIHSSSFLGSGELRIEDSVNNTFYNNSFDSFESIELYFDEIPNYFTYNISGVGLVGNYWQDLICTEYESRGNFAVCTNPSEYLIESHENTTDYAPLVDLSPELIDCKSIMFPGEYYLTGDVSFDDREDELNYETCFDILANNVTIDCQGNSITYDEHSQLAVRINRSSLTDTNFTLKNCNIEYRDDIGILFQNVKNNKVINVNLTGQEEPFSIGIALDRTSQTLIENVTLHNATVFFWIEEDSLEQGPIYCDNELNNVIDSTGLPILYYNETVNIDGWNSNFSQIVLCGADNSNLTNIVVEVGSDPNIYWGGIIQLFEVENVRLDNITFNNVSSGLFVIGVNDSFISNIDMNTEGAFMPIYRSHNNNFTNIELIYGIEMYNSSNNIFANITHISDVKGNVQLVYSANNKFIDLVDMSIFFDDEVSCHNNYTNILYDDKEVLIYNHSINKNDNWGNISQVILCDADNSNIGNLTLVGLETRESIESRYSGIGGLKLYYTDYANISNVDISNVSVGLWFDNSHFNLISDCNVNDMSTGLEIRESSNNSFVDLELIFGKRGINGWGSSNNSFENIIISENNEYGIYFLGKYFEGNEMDNRFVNISVINNEIGMSLGGVNNTIINSSIKDNIEKDISFGLARIDSSMCVNTFDNVITTGDKLLYVLNETTSISNWNNLSTLILCDADFSNINNVTLSGGNDALILIDTDNSTVVDLTITNNNNYGISFWNSYNNTFANSSIYNNENYDLYCYDCYSESFSNVFYGNNFGANFKFYTVFINHELEEIYDYTNTSEGFIIPQNSVVNLIGFFNTTKNGVGVGNYWGTNCQESNISYGDYYICENPDYVYVNATYTLSEYVIDGEDLIRLEDNTTLQFYDYAPLTKYLTKTAIPTMTINYPINDSVINVSKRSIILDADFSEDIKTLVFINGDVVVDLTRFIGKQEVNVEIPIKYGQNVLVFNFSDYRGQYNSKVVMFNATLQLSGGVDDVDGDGINDTDDMIVGNVSNVYTNVDNFTLEINNSNNLSQVFNQTMNVSFSRNSKKIVEFRNNFSSNLLNLTKVIVKDNRQGNKSQILVSGIDLVGETKIIYLDLLGDMSKYSSVCIKDAEIDDFAQISDACNGVGEFYIPAIPYSNNGFSLSYFNSSNLTVVISGLTHSGVSQTCTEDWSYSSWGACSSELQTRIATDANDCGTFFTRDVISQSCTEDSGSSSSSSPSGGGGGGYCSTCVVDGLNESNETNVMMVNAFTKPSQVILDKYEIVIDSSNILLDNYSGLKEIVVKDRLTQKQLVVINHDFTKSALDLSQFNIEVSAIDVERNFIIVSGIVGEYTKMVYLSKRDNTDTICIKDSQVNSISEVSQNCNTSDEVVLKCDNLLVGNYKCVDDGELYIISGLMHSAVVEIEAVEEVSQVVSEDGVANVGESILDSKIIIYLVVGLIVVMLLVIMAAVVMRKRGDKTNVFHSQDPQNMQSSQVVTNISVDKNNPIINSAFKYQGMQKRDYYIVKAYVQQYKAKYPKEELYKALVDAGHPKDIIETVLSEEF